MTSRSSSGTTAPRPRSPRPSTGWPATRVQVHRSPENHGFALGNNLALAHATGDVVVFLNNDTTVPPGWLAPLREALADDDVLGAQPLLLYPTGSIQSRRHRLPHLRRAAARLPQRLPRRGRLRRRGAAVPRAHRGRTRAAPRRRGGAARLRPGLHQRPGGRRPVPPPGAAAAGPLPGRRRRTGGPPRVAYARAATTSTSPTAPSTSTAGSGVVAPRDDEALWATRGLRVVDHEIGPARHGEPPRLRIPRPVLVREARLQVTRARRAALGDQEPRPRRTRRRAVGRHPLRRVAGRGAARPRPGGRRRPAPRVGPGHRPPRRRRARAARPGPPRPQPRAGLAALGHLAPRAA